MQDKIIQVAAAELLRRRQATQFVPGDLESRPTDSQLEIIKDIQNVRIRVVPAGNRSGKSLIICREIAWLLSGTHPYFELPDSWRGRPLQILLLGRTTKQIEESLHRYITGFLDEGSYKAVRQGQVVQKMTHLGTGNTVIYLSHHDWRGAQEKAQSFTCDYAAIDEMPGSIKLVEEVQRRVMLNEGRFIMGFTPKRVNREVQKWVEGVKQSKHTKVYKLLLLDNPAISEEERDFILESLEGYSAEYRQAVLEGDFMGGDTSVFNLTDSIYASDKDLEDYSPNWEHVVSVDPAISSKFGYSIWARGPASDKWICVGCGYIETQERLEDYVLRLEALVGARLIVRRVCDPASGWFIKLASSMRKWTHVVPYAKNQGRKEDLLTNFQRLLGSKLLVAPNCVELIDELADMQWSESKEGHIINSHKYHLYDTAVYFADCMPKNKSDVKSATSYSESIRLGAFSERINRVSKGRIRRIKDWHI